MKRVGKVLATIVVLLIFAVATFFMVGPARVWSWFGPADLGPVAFERLERRVTPNDALACPSDLCKARSDLPAPLFAVDVRALREAMAGVIATEPNVTRVAVDDAARTERYVQRSATLGFPDTVVVRYIEQPGQRSTLAIYSRSQLGQSDLGANKARLQRWLAKLETKLPAAR